MIRILAAVACLAVAMASVPAHAYIGEGMQGRPHGGARVAVRNLLYRHGYGYHRHPRRYFNRHY